MGGIAGHMDHLYDNRDLTFSEVKEILQHASDGELEVEEKVDGQNLFLSYSIPEGKAKGARNKGHYSTGGLDANGLAKAFADRGTLTKAFTGGFEAFSKAAEALSEEEKLRIFGSNANIWYNSEIMDPGTPDPESKTGERLSNDPGHPNIILYDNKTLKIHDTGHFIWNPQSKKQEPIPDGSLETLDSVYDRMNKNLHGHSWKLARKAIIELQKLEDDEALKLATGRLNKEISKEGLSDNSTILDYMVSRLSNGLDVELPTNLKKEIINYLLKLPENIGLVAIKKGLPPEQLQDIKSIIAAKKLLLAEAIEPLEMIIHDFSVSLLKGMKSVFVADTSKEAARLKDQLAQAVEKITSVGGANPQAMGIMQKQLNKIKDYSMITTPVEAVVFDYNGHTYKFAGNFAPLNQILGMFRYGNLNDKTNESLNRTAQVITEKDGKRIALFPGKFKPPHRGHFDYVNKIAKRPDVDEVIIMISPVDYPEVSNAQSLRIWEEYLENGEPNITAKIADYRSPVQAVYEFVADPKSAADGDTVLLVKSSKDVGDTRFDRAQSYAERHNPGVNVEDIVEDPVQSKDGIVYSARDMRKALAEKDKETFLSYAPPSVDGETLWNSLIPQTERLNSLIDDTIEEISTMAAGDVSGGGAVGFGPPNTYNPFKKRSKTSRPKVRRAKRQRRR